MRKVSGKLSRTQVFNLAFVLLAIAVTALNAFGYDQFTPDPWLAALVSSVVVPAVNMLIRKYLTVEPIA